MLRFSSANARCSRQLIRCCNSNGINLTRQHVNRVERIQPLKNSVVSWTLFNLTIGQLRAVHTEAPSTQHVSASAHHHDPTIYAISTGAGRAGIAIVRISGPACQEIYASLCPGKPALIARYATVRTLHHPQLSTNILDTEALLLYFPGPKTVTGEDVLELHIHGGPATIKAVLAALPTTPTTSPIRYAEAGEFTRRAFQNNRLDLAQVESLSDTLSAETEQQRRVAISGTSGVLGRTYEEWRRQLLYARGEVEAFIDFYEDQSFEDDELLMLQSIETQIRAIQQSISVHIEAGKRGELLRKGIRISMLGPPNAGKSSLLNRIVGREASIVSSEAGTTRDIVEVSLDVEGYLCTFADTAGLRSHDVTKPLGAYGVVGAVEAEGIRRAKAKAHESDVVIAFTSIEPSTAGGHYISYDIEALEIAAKANQFIIVLNKMDLVDASKLSSLLHSFSTTFPHIPANRIIPISCHHPTTSPTASSLKDNISTLLSTLTAHFHELTHQENHDLYGVTERQNQLLRSCHASLDAYLNETTCGNEQGGDGAMDIVLAAEYLRNAAGSLGRITGRGEAGDVEEVLGVVFEKFCVGK